MENMQPIMQQAPAAKRKIQPLEKPVVYEPTVTSFAKPQVKAISYEDESSEKDHFFFLGFLLVGAVLGLVSGILARIFPGGQYRLYDMLHYGDTGLTFHCLLYGAALGVLEAIILYPIYSRLQHVLPVYACFLFLPVILVVLSPILMGVTNMLFSALKFVLGLLGVVVVIAIIWGWLFG